MANPFAQTFKVAAFDYDETSDSFITGASGAYLTKLDLFFATKDNTLPVLVSIRKVDPSESFVTNVTLPFSRITLAAADINTSTDGSKPTPVYFETPLFLEYNKSYAIVVAPAGRNPNCTVHTGVLGSDDIITGNRITTQPGVGTLFAASSGATLIPIPNEFMKFRVYYANFGGRQSGTAVFTNKGYEFFTVDTLDDADMFNNVGDPIHGETTLNLSGALTANVGDYVVRGSANGIVTFNSGSTVRLKEVTTATKFTDSTVVYKYAAGSGANTGVSATINSQTTPTGTIAYYDNVSFANNYLYLTDLGSTVFIGNTFLRNQVNGYDGRLRSIENLTLDQYKLFASTLQLIETSATPTIKLATSASAKDSTYRGTQINQDKVLGATHFILSRTNEVNNISSAKSADVSITLANGLHKLHSPAIDYDRIGVNSVENLINNDNASEDGLAGGNADVRYITNTVTLAEGQDAEDLKVYIAAYKPATSNIYLYYKILNREDGGSMDEKSWVLMTQATSTTVISSAENKEDFKEYEFGIPTANLTGGSGEVQYTDSNNVTYTGFKFFKIKIVMTSSLTVNPPRVRDFRAIALQI